MESTPAILLNTQQANPIYDICEFCRLPVRPGESHGIVAPDEKGEPALTCRIKRLALVEQEIPAQLPTSALGGRR